jgi:SAM-dependent methyltransferase
MVLPRAPSGQPQSAIQQSPALAFRDHFSSIAPAYATFRPRYPAALFDFLAGLAPARTLAWDAACGNGQATVDLAERFEKVIGTDASAAQLAQAPAHPRIEWRVASAERSGIASGTVDLVTMAQALHWVDIAAFFREAQRVTTLQGVVAVWSYSGIRSGDESIDELVRQYSRETVGPCWPPQRRLVDEGYRSVEFPFTEIETPAFMMRERWTLGQLMGYIRTWSATSRYIELRNEDPTVEFAAQLAAAWGNPESAREVEWPLAVRMGRVER